MFCDPITLSSGLPSVTNVAPFFVIGSDPNSFCICLCVKIVDTKPTASSSSSSSALAPLSAQHFSSSLQLRPRLCALAFPAAFLLRFGMESFLEYATTVPSTSLRINEFVIVHIDFVSLGEFFTAVHRGIMSKLTLRPGCPRSSDKFQSPVHPL